SADLTSALRGDRVRLIAEVKRASPSRGVLRPDLDAVAIARTYAQSGAAAISVLTESTHFQGRLEHLRQVREALGAGVPILRKDFIFDPYQVYEARAYGADALLLIVAILDDGVLGELRSLARGLGMVCLVEVHDEQELTRALASGAEIVGINNRNLETFAVDLETTRRLCPLVPAGKTVVSESGIRERADIDLLEKWGVHACLVGEALVTAADVAAKVRELS
ncbi:MAG: indole-3-glycerol phosphate synthase TrpC, partial [Chloroflexota bacterium]|nr:indole-3-glycerol phosphate synthase TrpC [Chloroflexota bacterium]